MTRTATNAAGKIAAAEARTKLAELSAQVADAVEAGRFAATNEALMDLYARQTGRTDFRSFWDWKATGQRVMKGQKGFPLWARPLRKKASTNELAAVEAAPDRLSQDNDGPARVWPVAYVFHDGQVEADPSPRPFVPRFAVRHG